MGHVPFAATGVVLALLLTGTALGISALIGMLMLVGIVVTNAIVLLDLIRQYRDRGMGTHEAVVEGGRRRLRPILMTAVATICASCRWRSASRQAAASSPSRSPSS
jgi:HAE1 family hydrophobic/amphiphilic exporter-1